MKHSILSTMLLALTISLTITAISTAPTNMAFAIENYLQLRSADVNHHSGDIDVDIRTGGNIPSEKGNSGFGYAVLTDVGDEFVNNVLVAITDIGIDNYDGSKNDKLHTHVLDLTGDLSSDCSGSDYEVDKSSSDNEAFDTTYPVDVKGNKISIDNIATDDLASDTVKAIESFTAEAITQNGKIKHICIDIQDELKQSEISVSYDNNDNGKENNDDNNNDKDKSKNKDNSNNKRDDNDDLFGIDIDQNIDQSNECSGSSTCSNEGSNEANVLGLSNSGNDDELDTSLNINQDIDQSNECNGVASCSNEANNEANVLGYSSASDDEDFGSDIDIGQSIEQSNTCSGGATCSNSASNVANVG